MTPPNPAIVSQKAVQALPRWALLLLCLAYVVPGFVGRDPWKSADVTAFGYMLELAQGTTSWWNPLLGGMAPETDGLLPYWLGALAIQWAPAGLTPDMAARLPFAGMLVLTLIATWYGVSYLARSPAAQPVAFAFGGEAQPTDYARAMADGGLLALLACLGLAQLSHEATSYLVQLCCTTLVFFGFAALGFHTVAPALALAAGLAGLTLAGAPALAAMLGLGGAWLVWRSASVDIAHQRRWVAATLILVAAAALMAWQLDLWRWRIVDANHAKDWQSLARLLLWFGWPAGALAPAPRGRRAAAAGDLVRQGARLGRGNGAGPPPDAPHRPWQPPHAGHPSGVRPRLRAAQAATGAAPLPRLADRVTGHRVGTPGHGGAVRRL